MDLRTFLFQQLTTSPVLQALGYTADNVITQHDEDTKLDRPFLVIRLLRTDVSPFKSPVNLRRCQIWAHDRPSDFTRIDDTLKAVKDLLTNQYALRLSPESAISEIRWDGDSEDIRDDEVRSISRYGEYTIVGSAA